MARLALALAGIAAALLPSASASALGCRHRLVEVGDAQVYVRSICGEPAQVTTRTETRSRSSPRRRVSGRSRSSGSWRPSVGPVR